MRFPHLAAIFAVLATILIASPAQAAALREAPAYPVEGHPELTRNGLYRLGPLAKGKCAEKPGKAGDVQSAERDLLSVMNCLNQAWGRELATGHLPFQKPSVRFITQPARACGDKWSADTQALYCDSNMKITILLDRSVMKDPSDLFLLLVLAHEYGHHLQRLSGISGVYDALSYRDKAELNEQSRRLELQAECFGGVFIGSVWASLGRSTHDWNHLLGIERGTGDESTNVRDHGTGSDIISWLTRGFAAVSPSACDTWSAASPQVA
jgi:predicted metalloprotease